MMKRTIKGREARVVALTKWLASEDVEMFALVEEMVERVAKRARERPNRDTVA